MGGLFGFGNNSGSPTTDKGGLAIGATAGIQLIPTLGVGFTYLHNSLSSGGASVTVGEYLAELNFFSILFFPSGAHVGNINTKNAAGVSYSDLGAGLHTGLEFNLTTDISVGIAAYWTYVTTTNDKHSLYNVLVPIKFHL